MTLRRTHAFLAAALAPLAAFAAPSAEISETPALLPRPAKLEPAGTVGHSLANGLAVARAEAGLFPDAVAAVTAGMKLRGVTVTDAGVADSGDKLIFRKVADLGKEAYRLTVTPAGVVIEAAHDNGAFYATQTLVQAVVKDAAGKPALPALRIDDAPRFGWRGLMLDPCRHFITPANMKRNIDLMAAHKFNTLHWHLTEDQGWRIEIKAYPKLTTVGATRDASPVIGNRNKSDGKPYGPFFYTQEQVKEIVAYAKARGITIIPEIELPGHAVAAIAAYPELGNDDVPGYHPKVRTSWGVEPHVYAPKEATFKFIETVIGEVAALFPDAPYIHIGGDECPKTQWEKSPFAQKLMKEKGLVDAKGKPDAHKLQSWFIARVEKMINAHGKKLIGWDEIQEGGLSPTATMMVWRNWKWAKLAIAHGNDVVMSPTTHCYFDFGQGPGTPKAPEFEVISSNTTLEKVYSLEPIPEGIAPGGEKHVLGVQGNLWSEYFFNQAKWEYMAFPRAIALAEVGWSPKAGKDFKDFSARLDKHEALLDAMKLNYRKRSGAPARPDAKIVNE